MTYKNFDVDKEIPYRLLFLDNKKIDWVDIGKVYSEDLKDILFEDLSPILKIIDYKDWYVLEIHKEKSKWKLNYSNHILSGFQLKLIEPVIDYNPKKIEGIIIYERTKSGY